MHIINPYSMRRFVGGQIKVFYPASVFCGQIKAITTKDEKKLLVELDWMASGDGHRGRFPNVTVRRWVNTTLPSFLHFEFDLIGCDVNHHAKRRTWIEQEKSNHYVILTPPNAPLLNPRTVVGLRFPN